MLTFSNSIDIIIPSFRLDEQYLLPLIHLPKPNGWRFNYYVVVDNPKVKPGKEILRLAEEGAIQLFINPVNLGAGESRNKGINAGNGDWMLFLDDDIVADDNLLFEYVKAIEGNRDAIGFIGLTDFPAPMNTFTRALTAAGLTTIFTIAERKEEFMWGVTANMMYSRAAMGELRFPDIYPKNGGGEDVDLPAQICLRNNARFPCVKAARVTHPWWNDGQPHYKRFERYGEGMALLLPRFKQFTWYAFPNPVEGIVLTLLSAPLFFLYLSWQKWLILLVAIPLIDIVINCIRAAGMGFKEIKVGYYMTLLRCSNEWGMFKTMMGQGKLSYFMKRINIDFTRPRHFRTNRWRIIKLVIYIILLTALIF
ncbi:MAG: glycosyltransferase family 2 protein [Chitinophaga sp.]|uniref:glycosyltransferase family 2 protein n=1 Tax=Chitinophaga sp. TaxID=1869181 RepID=UPI001B05D854|nr:glycosyltransferase [Chitinophaga sp.]MBO9732590.1 glycosyltransferase family 2 protein [Chitinophaga sp.]